MFKWLILLGSIILCLVLFFKDIGSSPGEALARTAIWMVINIIVGIFLVGARLSDQGEAFECPACGERQGFFLRWSHNDEVVYCKCGHVEPLPAKVRYKRRYKNI